MSSISERGNDEPMEQQRQVWELMTYDQQVEEYKRLAQAAMDEPDPKQALVLCELALTAGRKLGFFDGGIKDG